MRIAVASSGLGHVARGIESWAWDLAVALAARGVEVTLFGAAVRRDDSKIRELDDSGEATDTGTTQSDGQDGTARTSGQRKPKGPNHRIIDVSSIARRATEESSNYPHHVALSCLRRGDRCARALARFSPPPAWRWGLKSAYGWEQFSFWLRLWPRLVRGGYDILHVQDPMVADWCRRFRRLRLVKTREILAHGTEEPIEFLSRFDRVQHLAPWHLNHSLSALSSAKTSRLSSLAIRPLWTAIPNFVDTDAFRPSKDADEKRACRREFGIDEDAFVIGCVAAVKKHHKRIDHLIREFATLLSNVPNLESPISNPLLLIAGARQSDSDELQTLAHELCRSRVRFFFGLPREAMPALWRTLDLFVLPSLFEMMPIAILEALASGVPSVVNHHPVLKWMVGDGGTCIDMGVGGALAATISSSTPELRKVQAHIARERAVRKFSRDAVISRVAAYYKAVLQC